MVAQLTCGLFFILYCLKPTDFLHFVFFPVGRMGSLEAISFPDMVELVDLSICPITPLS